MSNLIPPAGSITMTTMSLEKISTKGRPSPSGYAVAENHKHNFLTHHFNEKGRLWILQN